MNNTGDDGFTGNEDKRWDAPTGVDDVYIENLVDKMIVFFRTKDRVMLLEPEYVGKDWIKLDVDEDLKKGAAYWSNEPANGKVIFEWTVKPGDILIWWDHDLGDVVVDNESINEQEKIGSIEKVTDGVGIYWIT